MKKKPCLLTVQSRGHSMKLSSQNEASMEESTDKTGVDLR